MKKLKFRIVEFESENVNGDRFFVEVGTSFSSLFLGFIPSRTTVWKKNSDGTGIIGHKSIDNALEMVEELKKQQPKYHRVR